MKKAFSILALLIFMVGILSSCSKQKSCAAYSKADTEQAKEVKS